MKNVFKHLTLVLALGCAAVFITPTSADAGIIKANAGTTFGLTPLAFDAKGNPTKFTHPADGVVHVSLLGNCTVHFDVIVEAPKTTSDPFMLLGTCRITSADGATRLDAEVEGTGRPDPANPNLLMNFHYGVKFTGGTGQLANASGKGDIDGVGIFTSASTGTATWLLQGNIVTQTDNSVPVSAPVITSLGQNGKLTSLDLQPGSTASVEWASSVMGPWTSNWTGLESVTVSTSGMIQVSVPMFYRVRGTPPPSLGKATFTKWVTAFPNQPGLIANFGGDVGGAVGKGAFGGEVLLFNPGATVTDVSHFVAFYRFTGSDHSFSALVDVFQTGAGPGTKAGVTGVVTDGWMKGHAVKGEFTEGTCGTPSMPCFTGTLDIQSGLTPPSLGNATFTKWVSAFPNQPGLIANFGGNVGGAVGNGPFTGEVLLYSPGATATALSHFVAFYRFTGPDHSFTALVDVVQSGSGPGTKAVISGVVTDGWLKGHAVQGEYTEGICGTPSMPCFTGSLDIQSGY